MSHTLRRERLREQRSAFLIFMAAVALCLLTALPVISASFPSHAAASRTPSFEQLDRNHDGFVDRSEAKALARLPAAFEQADRNRDAKLDKVEYAKALAMIDGAR
jgi:EF hand